MSARHPFVLVIVLVLVACFGGANALAQEHGHGDVPAERPGGEAAHAEGGGEAEHHGYHPLDVRALAVQALGFAILVAVLAYFAFPFISDALGKRRQGIADGFDKIEREANAATKAKEDALKKLQEAERNASKRLEDARQEGALLREQLAVEANEQAAKILEKAHLEGKIEYAKMLIELRNEVVEMALAATEAIVRESMDKETQDELVTLFIDDLDRLAKKARA